ncbi:Protein kinase-like domain [Pseudocohnilembus persalinus]|uniref:Protein kinase-like domain n=1 Tax=Pseudocohnilembus persalinus TaxID=266149 RepID=A0A0V0QW06_PSEPJ|nr:Protein kinase-like domain [Pseudocohnilembus persalinus]|eukprot:KRX06374.1 Protein kinase-like domain [Pseudocohnilembus persalinus]
MEKSAQSENDSTLSQIYDLKVFTTTRINKQKQITKIPQGVPDLLLEPVLQQFGKLDLKMVIEDFEVVKVLGRGAFGKVVLAKYKANQQFYAIKCLKKEAINENNIDRIKVERQILECTNSPFLVKLHFAFQDPNRVYFVIDFKQGGELFFLIQQSRKFSEERAKFYAAQIILALEQLHKNNIIYRDLKPENILLDEKGNLSLADFGLSKIFESNQSEEEQTSHSFVGSAEYISPEILLNQGHSYSTDFWSLGALIYEMIYGLPPFYNKNQQKMFEMTLSREVRFNNKVQCSQECKNLILKLLQKIPKKRPNIIEIKKDEWFKDIDFQKIQNLEVQPPFIPQIENDEWVKNFDKECIQEQPVQSYVDNQKVQNFEIAGITYLEKKI